MSDVYGVKSVVNNMTVTDVAKANEYGDAGDYFNDSVITSKVKAGIMNDPTLKVLQISVQSSDGVVQLDGIVDLPSDVIQAADVAASVEGVKSVTNTLTAK